MPFWHGHVHSVRKMMDSGTAMCPFSMAVRIQGGNVPIQAQAFAILAWPCMPKEENASLRHNRALPFMLNSYSLMCSKSIYIFSLISS